MTSEFEHSIAQPLPEGAGRLENKWRSYALSTNARGADTIQVISLFTDLAGRRLLDVGMMHGGTCVAAKKQGGSPVGMDIVRGYFADAAANMRDQGTGVLPMVEGDIQKAPFRDAAFDIVVCSNAIEHVPHPAALAQEIARILRPGGLLYLTAPNRYGITQLMRDEHYSMPLVAAMPRPMARRYLLALARLQPWVVDFQLARPLSYWGIRKLFSDVGIRLELATICRMQSKMNEAERIVHPAKRRVARLLRALGAGSAAVMLYNSYPSACFALRSWEFVGIRGR